MKYKIGYTTGVFDLLHIGHLNILRKAKERCDYLIVGVSTDELVKQYKGEYPVMEFEDRASIVRALRYVDEVVTQETMDKFSAWEKYGYHVLFHGDDWKGSKLYQEIQRKLEEVGVSIVYFEYTTGISSTQLKDTLRNNRDKKMRGSS